LAKSTANCDLPLQVWPNNMIKIIIFALTQPSNFFQFNQLSSWGNCF